MMRGAKGQWLHVDESPANMGGRKNLHRTLEPPKPVLLLILPKSDGPSPRSLSSKTGRLLGPELDPPNQDEEAGAGLAGRNIRSASQSYMPGERRNSRSCCRLRFISIAPRPPTAAPVQKPGLHPAASAPPVGLEGYLVYGGGGSLLS